MKTIAGRLHAQGLATARFASAAQVVRHLGCVQSQLHDMALWSVGRRTGDLTLSDLQSAFESGAFLRTHVLRPTWHFIDPADIHWLLALTGPRIQQLMTPNNRSIGLTESRLDQAAEVIVALLGDGRARQRSEIAAALTDAGMDLPGQALPHVLMHAEIEMLIVNGPVQGKQHTYTVLPPPAATLPSHDEQLAHVARRYGRGHGPFRAKDLAWWTSLTLTDSRRAIELADLDVTQIDGEAYASVGPPVEAEVPRAMLLSNFDEYISYARDPDDYAGIDGSAEDVMRATGLLMVDGRLAGSWTRKIGTARVEILVTTSRAPRPVLRRAITREAEAFGRFVARETALTINP